MRLFLPKCLGITLLLCLYSIFLSAQTGPAGVNSGAVLWLDASDINAGGTAPTIGSTVSTWLDKSGSAHNATSTGTNTAIYTSGGANGLPVIHFNRASSGSGTGFTVNGLDIRAVTSPEVTVFAVYRQGTNDGNNQAVWGNDNGSQQRFFDSKWSTGTTDGSLSTGGSASVISGASTVGETRLVTGVYSGLVTAGVNTGASNASAVYLNGKKLSTFTDMTAASSGQSVFKIGLDGDDNYFNGDVSEVVVYNRKLTDCELETVSKYLAGKYGIDFSNIGSYYSLGAPINKNINGIGKPASTCSGNPVITSANSDIAIVSNPSAVSAGAVLTFANDGGGYGVSLETPSTYNSRLTQKWRADLTGIVGTVDICFNLEGLGIDESNSANFALLIDKDGNFSDASIVSTGVSVFGDRVCISGVSLTKGDYFTLATSAPGATAATVTSTNEGNVKLSAFATATVIDNQILVKGSATITNGRVYIDTGFVASSDVIGWGALPTGVTGAYSATTGIATFTGTATPAQWQAFYRTVTFRTPSGNLSDRVIRFVLGSVVTLTVGSKPHYYEAVTTAVDWPTAKAAAAAKTLYGMQGYLATVTSQAENDYIRAKLASTGWIGATDNYLLVNAAKGSTLYANQAAADGHYFWVTGPETGVAISNGLNTPVAVAGAYMNWNGGEPNNYQGTNEQYVQLNTLLWNDLPLSSILGYVIEYGGYPSDSVMNIDYSRVVRNAPAGPVLVSISNDSGTPADKITNDSTLTITGTGPANALITVYIENVGVIGTTTATNAGAWTFDYTGTILKDGTYNFTATSTVSSVVSAMSAILQVTVDRTAPAKPGTPALASGSAAATNTTTPALTGSAEPGSVVTIYVDGTSKGTATTDVTGKWTFTSPALTVATHSITVTAKDVAGNISVSSDAFVLKVDLTAPATPPAPTLVGGVAGVIGSATPTIKGTAEASSMVLIIKDGVLIDSVAADATGNYTYTFVTPLPEATYSITVKARDAASNLSGASTALSIKVDITPPATPAAPILVGGNNGVTNNNKPTIKGTADPNTTVIIFNNGVAVDSVLADASGNYTYTPLVAVADGTYTVTVKAKDAVGNVSGASPALMVTIDTGVPITPTVPVLVGGNNGYIGTSTPTITGVAEANSKVYIYKNGVVLDSVIADASGNYTYTFLVPLPDATYSIAVKDKDAAGNVSAFSPVLVIKVDTTKPTTPAAPVKVSGNDKPVIQGVAEANSTVTIYSDGVSVGTTTADASGNYTYTFTASLTDGIHAITVTATDAAGNVSTVSPALNVIVDTTKPTTPAAPVKVSGNDKPVISGVAEANSTVTIYSDGVSVGTTTADASGNYTYTFTTSLTDGTHAITVTATDAMGNVSSLSPALNVIVDTTKPTTPAAPVKVSGNDKPVISGVAEANSTVTIYSDGVSVGTTTADASGNYTYTFTTSLTDGTHAITVTATDAMGNVSDASAALNVTVDTTKPTTPGAPVKVSGNDKPVISGVAEANSTVTIYSDGVAVGTTTADASGNYTYTFTTSLTDGTHAITVTATDATGNVSDASAALNVTVDTTKPTTPAAPVKVSGNDKPVISGVAEANSTVTIYSDGVSVGTTTADASGNYTYTFTTSLTDGTHAITVTATDAVGNVSDASAALNVTVDTTKPTTPGAPVKVSGNDKPVISGVAEANSTVTIYSDGVSVGTTTADASGNYTYTFTTSLTDGAHAITVTATDAVGNVSDASAALNVTVDTTKPTTPGAPVKVSGNDKPVISGVAEANSTVTIYSDGVAVGTTTADASGNYTYTFTTSLTDGTHAITVTATDATGNVSDASAALNVTVDTTKPTTPAAPVKVSGNDKPVISGVAEANSTVTIYSDGVSVGTTTADASGNYTYTFTTSLTDGTHAITVTATDAVGNVSDASAALNVTVDTTKPTTPGAPVKVSGNDKPVISGVAEANSTVTIYSDGVSVGTTTADASGNYTYTFTTSLTDGTHAITVTATDAMGNVSDASAALNITVDTTKPTTPGVPVKVSGNDKPVISGVAEANSTVTIYSDGVSVGTTTADASGNYTYTFTTSLTDGTHAITITATDATGNVSTASAALNVIVDTTKPTTPAAPVKVSGNDKPVISGVAEANSTVTIYSDGVSVGTTTADASGNYTYTFTTSLTDGTHAITVTATDAMGNVSDASPALNVTVDTTKPTTPAAPVKVSGNDKPVISGVAEANSTVTIYSDGVSVGTTTADASGNYTYTFTTSLTDGTHAITVTATDATGNASNASAALNVIVDTTKPTTPAAPVKVSGNDKPVISGVAEANSTVTIYSDGVSVGTTTADASGNYTYTFTTSLTDGTHAITVTATDAAGNVSTASPALNVTVDTTKPTTPAAPVKVSGNDKPVISGVAEANSTVTIYSDGVSVGTTTADASGNYTYTFTTSLTDGTHAITVTATDATGNVSNASAALNIIVDTTKPTTPAAPVLVGGNNGVINTSKPTIKGVAEANATVIIYKGGIAIDSVTADASGNYTYTFVTALADGTYSITVKAKDAAGNVSAASPALSITVDTTKPTTPAAPILVGGNNGLTNDATPDIKGVSEANSTVTIYRDGVAVGTTTADASGNYTYTFPASLTDGAHAITVTATDAAGNVSAASPALNITIDTVKPATPSAPLLVGGINGVTTDATPDIKGAANVNNTINIYSDGIWVGLTTTDASGNYAYTFITTLPDGAHAITVTATDAAGNVSAFSPALNIKVDTQTPSTPAAPVLVGGNNGVININKPTIKGVAEASATVIIYKGGTVLDSVIADASGNYAYTFVTALADGTYSVTVKVKDAAGNTSGMSPALSFTVDTAAPATPTAPVLVGGNNGVTNDATPDITGKAEANSTVSIYLDGVKVGTATANASGNYTYTFVTALADGAHAITVTATDAGGNVSAFSPALNITVDASAPVAPPAPVLVSGSNNKTTDPTPDIKGTAAANSTITIYSDNVKAGTAVADASGNYTFTFVNDLLDGTRSITVTATDGAGNVSPVSPALSILIDAHAPGKPTAPVLMSGSNNITNDATPDLAGKAEANSSVTIYNDGVVVGTATVDASGNYTYTYTTALEDGSHVVTVTATDDAGNVSPASPALNFSVDTHAPGTPTAPVLVGNSDYLTNSATPTVTGKAEPNSIVTVYADGVAAGTAQVDANGNYTFTFPVGMSDGPHAITARATDLAGNSSESASPALNIVIDTKPPATPYTPVLVDAVVDGVVPNGKPTVTGMVDPNTTVTIYENGVAVGTTKADSTGKWTYTFETPLSNAAHAVTVTATDAAGNVSAFSPALNFVVDAHTPDVPLPPRLPGVNGKTNTTTPNITGQGEPGTLITIYTDGTKSGTALVDANGNWTYKYNPPLSESAHNIYVTASKADGTYESGHSETVILTITLKGPAVVLTSNANAGAIVNSTLTVTVTFADAVSGFSWDDVVVTNGKVTGFTQVSSGIYQVLVTSTENGIVTVEVPSAVAVDIIGNGNIASDILSINMTPAEGIAQVYPMPSIDVMNVRFSGINNARGLVSLTNMAGQVLMNQPIIIKNGVVGLNVQRLPGGTYVLLVTVKDATYHMTVVIAR